ncbi:MAG TPA: hypothetical protein EYP99_05200 [Candidatus Poseidoniales archaeon]|nr:hypothetical protein [Candidatus Poseidoniales archaeon]
MDSGRTIVILDGSNIMAARNDGTYDVQILRSAIEYYTNLNYQVKGAIKFGTTYHMQRNQDKGLPYISNLIEKGMLHEVRDDDLYIIRLAQKINAYIITKDKFPKERETHPEINWDDINSRIRRDWVVDSIVFIDPDLNENKLPITDYSIDTTYTSWIEDTVLTKTIRTVYDCILEASGMIYDPNYPNQVNISEKKSTVRDELSWLQGRVDKEKDEIYIICPEDLGKFAIGERGEILYAATRLIRESLNLPHVVKISVEFIE